MRATSKLCGRNSIRPLFSSALVALALIASGCGDVDATSPEAAGGSAATTVVSSASSVTSAMTSSATSVGAGGSGGGSVGIPFGPYGLWDGPSGIQSVGTSSFNMPVGSTGAQYVLEELATARAMHLEVVLMMTGGSHENYLTDGVFDLSKWIAKMDTYDTPEIRAAVGKAVADGIIVGESVMDEPNVYGLGDGNTWGPKGTMTKAKVDQLCKYVKDMFPTMPVGVAHGHAAFEPDSSYQVCEFIIDQYSDRFGDLTAYRDAGLALGARDGISILFSMNILNGGIQATNDGTWTCPLDTTGGRGTYAPNCRMTPDQVRQVGETLGVAGCAMTMWRYDETFMSVPDNQQAFADVAAVLATRPRTECRRTR